MKDYWETYDANFEALNQAVADVAKELPGLSAVMNRMTPAQSAEQQKVSRELIRKAALEGDWDPLLASQRQQGATYAAMGIAWGEWLELIAHFQSKLVPLFVERYGKDPKRLAAAMIAMNHYIDTAMSTIGEEYLRTKERIISQQQTAIQELSTPVLQLRDRLLLVPLVGLLDSQRARLLTEQLLQGIRRHRAKVVVIDITGVPAVDSKVANHLFQTVAAAKLMGARTVVTGLSADVAQALVTLGIDVDRLSTVGDLMGGLEEAERMLGYTVSALPPQTLEMD